MSFDKFARHCHVIYIAVGSGTFRQRIDVKRIVGPDGGTATNCEAGHTEQVGLRKARGGSFERV